MSAPATIYGVGLGPGDPELMSVKAARLIAKARVIAHFRKPGRPGNARTMVDGLLAPGVVSFIFDMPLSLSIGLEITGIVGGWWLRRERKRHLKEIATWDA